MPLLDHFRPPLKQQRFWHGFHNTWAASIAAALNTQLPSGYFAEPNVQFGIEIDVGTFHGRTYSGTTGGNSSSDWSPSEPTLTVPLVLIGDIVEIGVFHQEAGPTLVGAIELVSPSNKDREAHRDAFVFKCAAFLQRGIGLVLIDIVTERAANLHADLLARLKVTTAKPQESELYGVSYRPQQQDGQTTLAIWQQPVAVGSALPTLPFWLLGGLCMRLDLEGTYEKACRDLRLRTP